MKLVVMDGFTTIRDGLNWDCLKKFGELETYDWTDPEDVLERAKDADAVFTNKVRFGRKEMEALPKLKYIGALSTGMDHIDSEAAKELGIAVTNVPAYAQRSVPQLAFALLLELCYGIRDHVDSVMKEHEWAKQTFNSYWLRPLIGLEGKTLGVVGMGKIGQNVAEIGKAFGMKIVAYDVYHADIPYVEWMEVEDLLKVSDVVSLHCPLLPSTENLINERTLKLMKPTAMIINTSRGGLIDEAALIKALENGELAGAGLDVIKTEPPREDDPLYTTKNVIITPHIGWATLEARQRIITTVEKNYSDFLANQK